MYYKIKLQDRMASDDLKLWIPNRTTKILFELNNSSSFGLFAEGVALGKLRDFELEKFEISISLQQLPLACRETGKETIDPELLPPILFTLFGLELLHLSRKVEVDGDDFGINLRSMIGNHIWNKVRESKGVIDSGKFVYLVSRHGYDVPRVLRESPSSQKFPSFDFFQKAITPFINKLRGSSESSTTETKLIEWVFHCAENAFDHASRYEDKAVEGYRGIIIQKIKLELGDNIRDRTDLPDVVKNFAWQRIEDGEIGKEAILNAVTVVDLGVGIHNTVPHEEDQSDIELLQLAFKNGVTSKNINDHERAGYGLGEAADAARHMKALLLVNSGEETAYYDFSDVDERQIPGQELMLTSLGRAGKKSGTAISVIWASNSSQEDQLALLV